MQSQYFADASGINTYLLPSNPISDQVLLDAIYTDPYYGLEDPDNYAHWYALKFASNTTDINEKLAFQAELRTYF